MFILRKNHIYHLIAHADTGIGNTYHRHIVAQFAADRYTINGLCDFAQYVPTDETL